MEDESEGTGLLASVGRLGSLGELDSEPKRVQDQLTEVATEMRSLSVAHYEIHLENSRCVSAVRSGARESLNCTERVEDISSELSQELESFRTFGEEIAEKHRKNLQTLDKHVQLLELLEIPQLMDTCARNSLFDEALDLASFATTLQKRHAAISNTAKTMRGQGFEGTAIINAIAGEVYESAGLMRTQLLHQLRQKMNLPECLRYISYLRRLDAQERVRRAVQSGAESMSKSDEVQLRFEFLDCRDSYISSLTTEDPASFTARPYQSSLKLIERCRVNWFDVITQYKAIFASGENILQELDEDGGILARWVSSKMIDFLITLNKAISFIDDFASLANILEQAMKFGLSLARVGADFRPLLMEPFRNRIFEIMRDFWHQATERAVSAIEEGDWGSPLPIPRMDWSIKTQHQQKQEQSSPTERIDSDAQVGANDSTLLTDQQEHDESLTPPNDLLEFPVIAEYVNVVLSSFNELRQCASPIFAVELGQALVTHLHRIHLALHNFKLQRLDDPSSSSLSPEGQDCSPQRFVKLCTLVEKVMLPYLQFCFDTLFDKRSFSADVRTFLPVTEIRTAITSLVAKSRDEKTKTAEASDVPRESSEDGNESYTENSDGSQQSKQLEDEQERESQGDNGEETFSDFDIDDEDPFVEEEDN